MGSARNCKWDATALLFRTLVVIGRFDDDDDDPAKSGAVSVKG